MSLIEIANGAATLGHKSGSPISGGVFTISSSPSTKVKAGGQGVYRGALVFTFAGGIASGLTNIVGGGSISPTAVKVKADGQLVMRDGDFVLMSATGQLAASPFTPGQPISGNVEIADPGQTKARAQ